MLGLSMQELARLFEVHTDKLVERWRQEAQQPVDPNTSLGLERIQHDLTEAVVKFVATAIVLNNQRIEEQLRRAGIRIEGG